MATESTQKINETEVVSFEAALKELEVIVEKFEKGELTLDESISLFERGTRLAKLCSAKLDEAEARMNQLLSPSTPRESV